MQTRWPKHLVEVDQIPIVWGARNFDSAVYGGEWVWSNKAGHRVLPSWSSKELTRPSQEGEHYIQARHTHCLSTQTWGSIWISVFETVLETGGSFLKHSLIRRYSEHFPFKLCFPILLKREPVFSFESLSPCTTVLVKDHSTSVK